LLNRLIDEVLRIAQAVAGRGGGGFCFVQLIERRAESAVSETGRVGLLFEATRVYGFPVGLIEIGPAAAAETENARRGTSHVSG
jgi:hypothetical protein